MSQKQLSIFISCGELSGDRYGAYLVKALKQKNPNITFFGLTGPLLEKEGVRSIGNMTALSTIGFLEPLFKIGRFLSYFSKVKKHLQKNRPDLFIAIDSQGFHVPVLKFCKKNTIKTCYFIAPQEWQWGSEKGGKKICRLCNKILCIFKQESEFYKALGGNAPYIGHPLTALYPPNPPKKPVTSSRPTSPVTISLFPGSRDQEITQLTPLFFKTASLIHQQYPNYAFSLCVANPKDSPYFETMKQKYKLPHLTLYFGEPKTLIENTDLSLCCSGTITLEHALLQKPCIVAYKFSTLSFLMIRLFLLKKLRKRIGYMSLPNTILGQKIVPEFLQDEATETALFNCAKDLLSNQSKYQKLTVSLAPLFNMLYQEHCFETAALEILSIVD
jgi:lipid-A-disaccharide synthase